MLLTVIKYLGSAIIAGIVSWGVAKIAAKAEIRKLRETWAQQFLISPGSLLAAQ